MLEPNSRLKNTRETATGFFGKSERWLWENTTPRGSIPCVRFGRTVLYDWTALEHFVTSQATTECEVAE